MRKISNFHRPFVARQRQVRVLSPAPSGRLSTAVRTGRRNEGNKSDIPIQMDAALYVAPANCEYAQEDCSWMIPKSCSQDLFLSFQVYKRAKYFFFISFIECLDFRLACKDLVGSRYRFRSCPSPIAAQYLISSHKKHISEQGIAETPAMFQQCFQLVEFLESSLLQVANPLPSSLAVLVPFFQRQLENLAT